MKRYEKKTRQALCLYHEDLTLLELMKDSEIATIVRHLSTVSQLLANGEDVKPVAPSGLSDLASRIFITMANKAIRDQSKYEDRAQINAENRAKRPALGDDRTTTVLRWSTI